MDTNRLTRQAMSSGERYRIFLATLNQLYLQFTESSKPLTPKLRKSVSSQAYSLAEVYLSSELPILRNQLDAEMRDAHMVTLDEMSASDTTISDGIQSNTGSLFDELEHLIRTQLERDINTLIKTMRNQTLRGGLLARATGISDGAAMSAIRTAPTHDFRYTFLDRAGRNWPSDKFIKNIVRHAFVLAWNETALMTMAEHGIVAAIIDHIDSDFSELGTVISLVEDDSVGITWESIRDDVFHPNTNAWVIPMMDDSEDEVS